MERERQAKARSPRTSGSRFQARCPAASLTRQPAGGGGEVRRLVPRSPAPSSGSRGAHRVLGGRPRGGAGESWWLRAEARLCLKSPGSPLAGDFLPTAGAPKMRLSLDATLNAPPACVEEVGTIAQWKEVDLKPNPQEPSICSHASWPKARAATPCWEH